MKNETGKYHIMKNETVVDPRLLSTQYFKLFKPVSLNQWSPACRVQSASSINVILLTSVNQHCISNRAIRQLLGEELHLTRGLRSSNPDT
ncbi:hypothetical protein RRG08_060088 [Elysia crispata]|uniref:Uncharacterized protein n=1 Tax=Elysia crispata TaxID=231223 RepID=A0AAE1ACZ5_9GAST|nr:hypothetical protein RRG08_060088 [Elysia crispata]